MPEQQRFSRGTCLALGLAVTVFGACTAKPMRPAPGAALIDVTGADEEHGLLLFWRRDAAGLALEGADPGRYYVAKHDKDGPVVWARTLDFAHRADGHPLRVAGGSALLTLGVPDESTESLLRVSDRGEPITWTSTLPLGKQQRVWTAFGDAAQVFVFWTATTPSNENVATLEIAAFDQQTGERQWTTSRRVDLELRDSWSTRLTDGWLMFSDAEGDWELLRRSDGQRSTVVADAPGLCNAGGRWWAQRDDQLLALDLGSDGITAQPAIAQFIAPERRHQWSLEHCAESGDEVVLMVNQRPGGGMLVGLDPVTTQMRWTFALPWPVTPTLPRQGTTAPTRFGKVAVMSSWNNHCAVDLAQREQLWCTRLPDYAAVISDGEDTLMTADIEERQVRSLVRIGGADGKIQAAIEVRGARQIFDPYDGGGPGIRGGNIWLRAGDDPGALVGGTLPHVVLDARTLRPIARPMLNDQGAADPEPPAIQVRDMMTELDLVFMYTAGEPWPGLRGERQGWGEAIPDPSFAINPLDHWAFGRQPPAAAGASGELPALALQELSTLARARAELPADAAIRVLAWRIVTGSGRYVNQAGTIVTPTRRVDALAVAEHQDPAGTRWVLLRGEGLVGDVSKLVMRSFTRRPTEYDIHRFLELPSPYGWLQEILQDPDVRLSGVIDDTAWQALTGAPRVQQWMRCDSGCEGYAQVQRRQH